MQMVRRGASVRLFARERPARLDPDSGVRFVRCQAPAYPLFESPPHDLALCSQLVAEHAREPFTVLHAHYAIPHAALALFARQMLRAPKPAIVATLHGTDALLVGTDPAFEHLYRWTLANVDALTAVSQHLLNVTGTRAQVIPNWVAPRAPIRALPGPPRIVHVSNFRPVKRAPLVVDLFAELASDPDVPRDLELWMVGDGPDRAEAQRRANATGLAARVRWLGATPDPHAHVAGALAFVLPSAVEAFGLAALEAMALGVVPVVSAVGGLPELVTDGVDGYLIPEKSAVPSGVAEAGPDFTRFVSRLRALCVDVVARERMSRVARERATVDYTPDRIMGEYEAVYRRARESMEKE